MLETNSGGVYLSLVAFKSQYIGCLSKERRSESLTSFAVSGVSANDCVWVKLD